MSDNVLQLVVNNKDEEVVSADAVPGVIEILQDMMDMALSGELRAVAVIGNTRENMIIKIDHTEDNSFRVLQVAGLAIAQQRLIG